MKGTGKGHCPPLLNKAQGRPPRTGAIVAAAVVLALGARLAAARTAEEGRARGPAGRPVAKAARPTWPELHKRFREGRCSDLAAAVLSRYSCSTARPHPGIRHPVFKPKGNVAALEKQLAAYLTMDESELRRRIDERGSTEGDNFKMRAVAYDLARAWALTKEPIYARRAAVILHRYAEVLPHWPVSGRDGKLHPQNDISYFRTYSNWAGGGLWTPKGWYHSDLINAVPVFKAWDLVCTSEELDRLSAELNTDVRAKILDDLLYRTIRVHLQWPFSYGNMYGHRLGGLAQCGLALGDPMIVHAVRRELAETFVFEFHYDGSIRELAPGYGRQLINRLVWCMRFLKGYSSDQRGPMAPWS